MKRTRVCIATIITGIALAIVVPAFPASAAPSSNSPFVDPIAPVTTSTTTVPTTSTTVVGGLTTAPTLPAQSNDNPGMFDVTGQVRKAINDWITSLVTSAINPALDLVGKTLLSAPDITDNAAVHSTWLITLGIADTLFVLMAVIGGIIVMTHETMQTRYSVKDIAPRLVIAVIAANCSTVIASQLISLSNALAQGLLGDGVDPSVAVGGLGRAVVSNAGSGGFLILLAAVATVMGVMLGCLYLLRSMLVVVLVVAAPLMLACHALPQTDRMASLWWRSCGACFGIQVTQALVLIIAVRVFFAPDGSNVLGLSAANGFVELLIMLCLFWIMLMIPVWAMKLVFNGGSAGRTTINTIKTVAAVVAK